MRILVVEDFAPFRRFIVSILQTRPALQVIGEASDGLEAVQKAQELQPELIVLDIGLPILNGIESARRIRKLLPATNLLFLTQESSADIARKALESGAQGYVVKTHAGSELLPAVEAVLQGNQYVGSGLSGHWFTDVGAHASGGVCNTEVLSSPPQRKETTHNHEACFYTDDAVFLLGFTRFIESALEAQKAVIVIATASHLKSFLQSLRAHGVDCANAIEQGRYITLDVVETLSSFMANDLPNPVRFYRAAGALLSAAAAASKGEEPRVAVCGEAVSLLWAQGHGDAAVQLEHLWEEMTKIYDLDILCGYLVTTFQRDHESDIYMRICAEHSSVCSQ